jgi:hypothetical protein
MSRPRYKPDERDRKEVETMSGLGLSHEHIAAIKGISRPTLYRYFKAELALGNARAVLRVSQSLYGLATRQNASAAACIFFLKTQGGENWREKPATLGKKEEAELAARDAEAGTGWAGLLQPGSLQ